MHVVAPVPDGPAWELLFRPIRSRLEELIALLPARPALPVLAGPEAGPWASLGETGVLLSSALLQGGLRAPPDQAWAEAHPEIGELAPDRWRRATSALLEGLAQAALAEQAPAGPAWWREALAAEQVDALAPELGGIWTELADLREQGCPGLQSHPRQGAWLARWLHARGQPPSPSAPPELTDADLAAFGAWIRDPSGPVSRAPLPLPLGPSSREVAWVAPPWSWRAITLEAGPAGLRALAGGAALHPSRALAGGETAQLVAGSAEGGLVSLALLPAGPVGTWSLSTGVVHERVGAARGVELELAPDGRLEIILADGFMGLPTVDMLSLAESVGVSGWASGRWRLVSAEPGGDAGELLFVQVSPRGLTLHPRGGHAFAVPAASIIRPAEQILSALSGVSFRWRRTEEGLTLTGRVTGVGVELRFRGAAEPGRAAG